MVIVSVNVEYIFLPHLLPLPILCFQQNRAALKAFQAMPLTALDVENRTAGGHVYCIGKIAVFIIKVFNKMPADANAGFTGVAMTIPWLLLSIRC